MDVEGVVVYRSFRVNDTYSGTAKRYSIDLHTHTDRSDGSTAPDDLVRQACAIGLQALAIADHDTLAGYDAASPMAAASGLELICAVELSTRPDRPKVAGRRESSVHVLGYWLHSPPTADFRKWLETQQATRRRRNVDLMAKLNQLGVVITLEDAEVYGRNQVGRPTSPSPARQGLRIEHAGGVRPLSRRRRASGRGTRRALARGRHSADR